MPHRLPPLNALRAFDAAARHLSFKNAARELSVTPTAVSHQIKSLEEFLGVSLFNRLTRALELTPQGLAMVPKVREGLACFMAAAQGARDRRDPGRLVLVVPPSFATRWLVPRLRGFALAAPGINLQLIRSPKTLDSDQPFNPTAFDELDLRAYDALAVIRYGAGKYAGCQVDRMFGSDYIAVCSPKLMEGEFALRVVEDIRHHVLLHDESTTGERFGFGWKEWLKLAGVQGVDSQAGPHFSDSGMVYVAALDGLGVALAAKPLVANALAQGRLVAPFDIAVPQNYAYHLVVPQASSDHPLLQTFRQWLLHETSAEAAPSR